MKILDRKEPPKKFNLQEWTMGVICQPQHVGNFNTYHCGSKLLIMADDVFKVREIGYTYDAYYVICPVCQEKISIYIPKEVMAVAKVEEKTIGGKNND